MSDSEVVTGGERDETESSETARPEEAPQAAEPVRPEAAPERAEDDLHAEETPEDSAEPQPQVSQIQLTEQPPEAVQEVPPEAPVGAPAQDPSSFIEAAGPPLEPADPDGTGDDEASSEVKSGAPTDQRTKTVPVDVIPPIVPHEPVMMQVLGGIVTAVSNKEVDLTLDDGRTAVIHRENFDLAGTDPTTVLQVGDGAEGAVLSREDPHNRVVLSRKWVQRDRAWKKAAACVEDHSTMHLRIVSVSKKGVVVDVMGLRGFVPVNHFQLESSEPSAELVGQMVELRVIAADRQKDKLLLSRRSQLLKEQRKNEVEALQKLKVGSVVKGRVVDLTRFGAFVEIGDEDHRVRGLLHVSEMSWDRISSPKGHVVVGEEIDVKIIDVKVKKKRVSLSRKELIDDPLAGIEVGSIHTGKVKRLADYGVFVDIGPAQGMVHLSEIAEYRPSHPSEIVLKGDEVQVKVLKVSRAKRRIELSMRQALYPS